MSLIDGVGLFPLQNQKKVIRTRFRALVGLSLVTLLASLTIGLASEAALR
jgi:hypothetical protein